MHRLIPLILLTAGLARSAQAQDLPRQYETREAVVLASTPDADKVAQSDALGNVRKLALTLKFTCATPDCKDAGFSLRFAPDLNVSAVAAFDAHAGVLQPSLSHTDRDVIYDHPLFSQTPAPGETFDLVIDLGTGSRVTFDLYRKDAATGRETMESHDLPVKGEVRSLFTTVSGGELTLVRQAYTFR